MSANDKAVANWLAEHPELTGVLFTTMLLLSQAGTVAAGNGGVSAGP